MKAILFLILATLCVFKVSAQTQCQLCMQTYKINCSICYNECLDTKDFNSCTYSICVNKDADGNCINWTSQSLNSSYCLGSCCNGFETNKPFNEPDFNLCVQRDAAQSYNVNIGLTLGLILSLFGILFLSGLGCLLMLIFFEKENRKANMPISAEGINTYRPQKQTKNEEQIKSIS